MQAKEVRALTDNSDARANHQKATGHLPSAKQLKE